MFELTGRQRLTFKRGIRNVGQFLEAEVTNLGQNESQQMFALCDRINKEGDILDRDSSPNESPDRVKEEERGIVLSAYQVVFCMFLFSFICLILFSLNVLYALKNITWEIGIVDYDK